jgi:hypothetical protein
MDRTRDRRLQPRIEATAATALALCILCHAARTQEVKPTRTELSRAPLIVHVVDDATDAPLAGASVNCISVAAIEKEMERRWRGLETSYEQTELDEVALQFGTTKSSDAHGDCEFESSDGKVRLMATTSERFGVARVDVKAGDEFTLRVKPDESFDVYVVDSHGKGVGGIPVASGRRCHDPNATPSDGGADDAMTVSRNGDGRARFTHAKGWSDPSDESLRVFVLALAVVEHATIRKSSDADATRRELLAPPTARVVLRFPGVDGGVAQIRRDRPGQFGNDGAWRDDESIRAEIAGGAATFNLVGLGAPLRYRATWPGLVAPVDEPFVGPDRAGVTLDFEAKGAATIPLLVGRIVDEDGHPITNHRLEFNVGVRTPGTSSRWGFEIQTDGKGRFQFDLVKEVAAGETRELTIGEPWNEKRPTLDRAAATLDFSTTLAAGVHDLGDVALLVPGSRKLLRNMDDSELERWFLAARQGHAMTDDPRHDADTCLTEMAERGGSRWQEFITRELAASRRKDAFGRPVEDSEKSPIEDVALLTTLRRLQRLPDPVVLEVEGGPLLETVFPVAPVIQFRVKNVDAGGATISLSTWELDRFGMNEYCRIDVHASDGSIVQHYDGPKFVNGGASFPEAIAPGGSAESAVALEYFVHLPRPGDYQAVLHQRHGDDGSGFAYSKGPLDGWICSSSEPFTIRVHSRPIELTKSERERLLGRFRAIDVSQPTPLVWKSWEADDEFKERVTSPQDELYLAGWTVVPVLLDVLDESDSTPQTRAWALALLTDVTGLNGPERFGSENPAWGRHQASTRWPGLKPTKRYADDDKPGPVEGPAKPDVAQQTDLIRRWREIRNCLAIHE